MTFNNVWHHWMAFRNAIGTSTTKHWGAIWPQGILYVGVLDRFDTDRHRTWLDSQIANFTISALRSHYLHENEPSTNWKLWKGVLYIISVTGYWDGLSEISYTYSLNLYTSTDIQCSMPGIIKLHYLYMSWRHYIAATASDSSRIMIMQGNFHPLNAKLN